MTSRVTIITPTYNKPTYFKECAESVLNQTFKEWVWWPILNFDELSSGYEMSWFDNYRILPVYFAVTPNDRKQSYIPARIINWLYPKVQTPYILFLADDDLLDPQGLEKLVEAIEPEWDAVYGRCEVQVEQPDRSFKTTCWAFDVQDVGLGTGIQPDCRLDGGQILHTKSLWDRATVDGWRLTDSMSEAGHCDGILLNRLADFATIHYVPQRIVIHRRTKLSEHIKP